jgi:signal peptide peptidase SppA
MISEFISIPGSPLAFTPEGAAGFIEHLEKLSTANPTALEGYRPHKHEQGERLGQRGDTAVLYVEGPLLKRETWLTKALGFTTYETLRRDLQVALDDRAIKSIVLHVDSAGGEANGCDELATTIFHGRSTKPIRAYVSGMACSAAYWIASAADRITVSESAIIGSIGVVMSTTDRSQADNARGITRRDFVSSSSPGKRPDLSTDRGRASVQKMVDDLGDVFVKSVAKFRGVTPNTVVTKFGQGGVHIGSHAVKAGMVDAVGQFESVLSNLAGGSSSASFKSIARASVAAPAAPAPIRISAEELAAQQAAARVSAILNSNVGKANPKLAQHYAFETNMPVQEAVAALKQDAIDASWKKVLNQTQHHIPGALTHNDY